MKSSLNVSLGKLLAYCLILGLLLLVMLGFSKVMSAFSNANANLAEYIEADNHQPKTLFIGSSRMQTSIDTDLLKSEIPQFNFYNLGLSGSSILYNCSLAEKTLPWLAPGSRVFIELSDYRALPPGYFYVFNTHNDLWGILKNRLAIGADLNEFQSIFFSLINVKGELLANVNSKRKRTEELGFARWKTTYTGTQNTFVDSADMQQVAMPLVIWQSRYLALLNELIQKGQQKNVQIVFVLPLNIRAVKDKKELMPIYHAIPEANKWIYTSDFLSSISNNTYLGDFIHLNEKGAKLYTEELIRKHNSMMSHPH